MSDSSLLISFVPLLLSPVLVKLLVSRYSGPIRIESDNWLDEEMSETMVPGDLLEILDASFSHAELTKSTKLPDKTFVP